MIISYILQCNSDTGSASLFSCLDASIWHCRADTAQNNAVQKLHGIQMHLCGASVLSKINQLHGCSHSTSLKNSWNCTVPVRYILLPPLPPASVTSPVSIAGAVFPIPHFGEASHMGNHSIATTASATGTLQISFSTQLSVPLWCLHFQCLLWQVSLPI